MRAYQMPGASGVIPGAPTQTNAVYEYMGFSVAENAGTPAAAKFRIREGGAITGNIIEVVTLAASGSNGRGYSKGVQCQGQLYFELVSGSVEGNVRIE